MMLCIVCKKEPAINHPSLGLLPCKNCGKGNKRELPYEFQLASVKESRKEYAKDIIQSSRDGVLSRERLDAYGTRGLKVTPEQIKSAKYVWGDIKAYKEGNPTLI